MSTVTIGIDPGGTGAIATLVDGRLVAVADMPHHDGVVAPALVLDILAEATAQLHVGAEVVAWVEDVHDRTFAEERGLTWRQEATDD